MAPKASPRPLVRIIALLAVPAGTRRGSVVCWVRAQVRTGTPVTVRYRAVARRAGTVSVLGTAVAGNAARVSDRSSLPVLGVSG